MKRLNRNYKLQTLLDVSTAVKSASKVCEDGVFWMKMDTVLCTVGFVTETEVARLRE